ncbi:glycoside hydrolase family 26 protein [Streptomyces sp. NPDC001922]|uniref:glycoside hydrolase family 26 protein n=1 Tax=Streptomyces sp. NPDC001922 TaxID=3364624 RepID=UPI003678D7BF
MSHPSRRLVSMCLGVLAVVVILTGAAMATAGPLRGGSRSWRPEPAGVPWGAFLGSGADGVRDMTRMQEWLGGTELRVGHTYLPGNHWTDIEGDRRLLGAWARWRDADPDRLFVLNVPMLDRNEARVPDREVAGLLERGAQGEFDEHFRTLAARLVELGLPDTVIVPGWEMNGTTYTGRCAPNPEAWKAYWMGIVMVMRSVPGQRFRFDFAPSRGEDAIGWTHCYPGDDVVDIIGMDSYDQPPGNDFDEHVDQPFGLRAHVEFAEAHGKPISYPEWGLFRNGDNPEYMRRMLKWIADHPPEYHTITDYCPHGVWGCGKNPLASRVFRSVQFTGVPGAEPGARADCLRLDLGPWLSPFVGRRRLCVRFWQDS